VTIAPDHPDRLAAADDIALSIDGFEISVPKGTLIIRAAEQLGIAIPRFCDHPLLDPVGACRQCIVEVEGQRKPMTACTTQVTAGMVVKTHLTSDVAAKAQAGTLELLLINHPLDCPICDKGGECPLQNQTLSNGPAGSRFHDVKRTFTKPLAISAEILLDRERCVLCARCTRFSQQIAGDPFIDLFERGPLQQVAVEETEPFSSYFSGNTVQICPVGALTSAAYRFRSRPFDLVSTPSTCEHCAAGCAQRVDHRRGRVTRRLAGEDPEVNEEWNCDKGRFAFSYATLPDRLTTPLVRDASGELVPASWSAALGAAAAGLSAAGSSVGVLPGGRLSVEDAYAYAKFARVALGTDNVDFRSRPHSKEEADWLAATVAGRPLALTYADVAAASEVLLVGLEPEEECPILFLRLRRAARDHGLPVRAISAVATPGLVKCSGELVATAPGGEPAALDGLSLPAGAVVLVGERMAEVPGALSAVTRLVERSGARVGWVPRRAGERGALEAGALAGVLPGGRRLRDKASRTAVAEVWSGADLPRAAGLDTAAMLAAAETGSLSALVVGGVDPADLADPAQALAALDAVGFLVSLEIRASAVTERADVVLPVAAFEGKEGTFLNWEGRARPFPLTLDTGAMSDLRVLHVLAGELGVALGLPDAAHARAELAALGSAPSDTPAAAVKPRAATRRKAGEVLLATHALLVDLGRLQDGEPHLAATAHPSVARVSAATAARVGVAEGEPLTVTGPRGSVTLPTAISRMPDDVVWVPTNSAGARVRTELAAGAGSAVRLSRGA
jgi:NADH-quinone oxidoreductase subunit G